jgi:hypothetical protein
VKTWQLNFVYFRSKVPSIVKLSRFKCNFHGTRHKFKFSIVLSPVRFILVHSWTVAGVSGQCISSISSMSLMLSSASVSIYSIRLEIKRCFRNQAKNCHFSLERVLFPAFVLYSADRSQSQKNHGLRPDHNTSMHRVFDVKMRKKANQ